MLPIDDDAPAACECNWDVGEHCEECAEMYLMTVSEMDDEEDDDQ